MKIEPMLRNPLDVLSRKLMPALCLLAVPAFAVSDAFLGVRDEGGAAPALAAARAEGDWARAGWVAMVYAGDEAAARDYFARALAADAGDEAALEGAAWLDFIQGRMPQAYDEWRRYLDAYPGGDAAPAFASMFRLFDGVVPAYPETPDFLTALAGRADCPAATREAAARAAGPLLMQMGRWDDAAAFAAGQGFLEKFAVCGVFHKYGQTDIDVPFEPETRLAPAPAVAMGERAWRDVNAVYGAINIGGALGFNVGVAYATTSFDLPAGGYALEMQSDDWYRVFINGAEVLARRPYDAGAPAVGRAGFKTGGGPVRILVKIMPNNDSLFNSDGVWAFKTRVLRAADAMPVAVPCRAGLTAPAGPAPEVKPESAAPAAAEGTLARFYAGTASGTVESYGVGAEAVDRAIAAAPSCALFYLVGAYVHILAGGEYNLADAKAQLRRARAEDPACVLATEELAVFASFEGKRDEAVDYYRRSLEAEPGYISSYCGLGEIASREGWEGEALRQAEAALRINPGAHRAWRLLADYYYDRDNVGRAAEYYEKYLALKADDVDARRNLAEAYLYLKAPDKARGQYEAVLRADPYREIGYLGLADDAARRGDDAVARAWFEKGAAAVPRSAEIRRQWGYYLCGHGAREDGFRVLKSALELDGSDYNLRFYLEREGAVAPDAVSAALAAPDPVARAADITAEKYPHADTAMLLDQTAVFLNDDYSFTEANVNYIKILNDKGRERWGEITVMSDAGTEIRAARTHLANGETADATSIKDNGDYKIISMEQVVPGAVLEVAYDLNLNRRMIFNMLQYYSSPFYMSELGETLEDTRWALVVPDDFPARERLSFDVGHQRLRPKRIRGNGRTAYLFERRAMPAVVEEPMMPSKDAYVPYVRATTLTDVATLAEWYRGELWGKTALDDFLRQRLTQISFPPGADEAARAAAVYYYVVTNVESSGGSVYYPAPAHLTSFRGRGRSVDRAVLMVTLCRALRIPAKLALVGTGGSKGEWKFVAPDMFDTILVYFPTLGPRGTFADPLLKNVSFGSIWASAYGKPVLLVDEDGYEITRVPAEAFAKDNIGLGLTLTLEAGGAAKFAGRRVYRGLRGAYRESFTNPEEQQSNVEIALSQVFTAATVTDYDFENLTDARGDFVLNFEGRVPNFGRPRGGNLAVPVVAFPYTLAQIYITAEKRRYPLRVERPEAWLDDVRIKLPPGYVAPALPAAVRFRGPQSEYAAEFKMDGDDLVLTRRLFIDQGDISPRAYAKFVVFCKTVDAFEKTEIMIAPAGRATGGD